MIIDRRGLNSIEVGLDESERKLSAECVLPGILRLGKCNAENLDREIEKLTP